MNTQARVNHIPQPAGFVVPDVLPDFPTTPRAGLRLSLEQEQAFGFTVFQLTLDQIQALACDREVVAELLSEMEGAFTKENKADKAVALIKVDGQWFRQGSIPAAEFSKYSRDRIQLVRQCLDALNSLEGGERDLFYMEALDSLRKALSLLVPYDAILSKAVNAFKSRCGASQRCLPRTGYVRGIRNALEPYHCPTALRTVLAVEQVAGNMLWLEPLRSVDHAC